MATYKSVKGVGKYASSLKRLIDYVSEEKKGEKLYKATGINVSEDKDVCFNQMMLTKRMYDQLQGRQYKHHVQSFAPGEVSPKKAHAIGVEFAKKHLKNFDVLVATHIDKKHIHNHFVINNIELNTGLKYAELNKREDRERRAKNQELKSHEFLLEDFKTWNDEICLEHGLSVIDRSKAPKSINIYDMKQYKGSMKKGSYKKQLARDVLEAIKKSKSREEFCNEMLNNGVSVDWKDSKKHVTFKYFDGKNKSIRLKNLRKTYQEELFTKEEMEKTFMNNKMKENVADLETIYQIQAQIMRTTLEKKMLQEKMKQRENLKLEAMKQYSKKYADLDFQLEQETIKTKKNWMIIYELESNLREMEESVDEVEKVVSAMETNIEKTIGTLSEEEENLHKNLESKVSELEQTDAEQFEEYYKEFQYKNWEMFNTELQVKENKIDKLEKELEVLLARCTDEKITAAAFNSLTKGQFGRDEKVKKELMVKQETTGLTEDEVKKLGNTRTRIFQEILRYTKTRDGKNKMIRRKYSIRAKMRKEFAEKKEELAKAKLEVMFIKDTMASISPEDKEKNMRKSIELEKQSLLEEKESLEYRLQFRLDAIADSNINRYIEGLKKDMMESTSDKEIEQIRNTISYYTADTYKTEYKQALKEKFRTEIRKIDKKIKQCDKKLTNGKGISKGGGGGSPSSFKNFNRDYVEAKINAALGGLGNATLGDEDKLDKQMKRELDFGFGR